MLERNSPKPLYQQLEDILRVFISNGEWSADHPIPSENELSKQYGLSRMTVRTVITNLVREGLLYRVQGKGTFVVPPKITTRSPAYLGIREQLEEQGYSTATKLVEFTRMAPPRKVKKILGLKDDEPVIYIRRARYVDGSPISIHTSYIPHHCCPTMKSDDLETVQLCKIMENDFGLKPSLVHESLETCPADDEQAQFLNIGKNHPLLVLDQILRTQEGEAYEYTQIVFRGDKMKLNFDYNLEETQS